MAHTIIEAKATPAFRLKYKGIVDYDKISTFIIKWLQDRHYKINESKHKHKMSCPHGFEIERGIAAWKKIDGYYQHNIDVKILLWDAFEVDAVKHGKKVKLWNARIEVQLGFKIVCDYAGKWDKSPFIEKLHKKVYVQYVIKKEIIIKHADPLYYKLLSLHTKLKKILEMESGTVF